MHSYVLYCIPQTKLGRSLSIASHTLLGEMSCLYGLQKYRERLFQLQKNCWFFQADRLLWTLSAISFEVRYQYKTTSTADCIRYLFISALGEENLGFENTIFFFLPNEAQNFFKHPKITSIWFYRGLHIVFNHPNEKQMWNASPSFPTLQDSIF